MGPRGSNARENGTLEDKGAPGRGAREPTARRKTRPSGRPLERPEGPRKPRRGGGYGMDPRTNAYPDIRPHTENPVAVLPATRRVGCCPKGEWAAPVTGGREVIARGSSCSPGVFPATTCTAGKRVGR